MPATQATAIVTLWPIADLLRYSGNARTHSPEQIAGLADSIRAFGLAGTIVVRERVIAKGHGTLAACQRLLAQGEAIYPVPGQSAGAKPFPRGYLPVQDATGWTEAAFRAFVLADNQHAALAGWNTALLEAELAEIARLDFDLVAITGLDLDLSQLDAEITAALRPAAPPPTDPADDAQPDDPADDPTDDPADHDPATPGRAADPPGPLIYQVIVGMDQATKRRYLRLKRQWPSVDTLFRAAIEHLDQAHATLDPE